MIATPNSSLCLMYVDGVLSFVPLSHSPISEYVYISLLCCAAHLLTCGPCYVGIFFDELSPDQTPLCVAILIPTASPIISPSSTSKTTILVMNLCRCVRLCHRLACFLVMHLFGFALFHMLSIPESSLPRFSCGIRVLTGVKVSAAPASRSLTLMWMGGRCLESPEGRGESCL